MDHLAHNDLGLPKSFQQRIAELESRLADLRADTSPDPTGHRSRQIDQALAGLGLLKFLQAEARRLKDAEEAAARAAAERATLRLSEGVAEEERLRRGLEGLFA